ncbi:hypothetical protein HZ994_15015 [Akkermansiaceae bacterium]|nr:hypothetical protein HZ994_15015 [Akkermansiaceae bacterium]
MAKMRHLPFPLALVSTLVSLSCTEEKIRTYRVAPDDGQPAAAAIVQDAAAASGALRWTVPDGWEKEQAGQFQTALYDLGGGGKVSVSNLPGDAGGETANVNRWRQQVGLEPLDQVSMETVATEGDGITVKWCQLEGEAESIMAAIISLPAETWFFKLNAPTAAITAKGKEFSAMLTSIEFAAKTAGASAAAPAAPEAPAGEPGIGLEVPEGWKKSEGSSMRVASFAIPGDGFPDGDVSVIPLAGESGSILENVNRWRAQLKLGALPSEDDPAIGKKASGASGEMLITHIVSEENVFDESRRGAISTAILREGDTTWFFKLAGEAGLVAANREKFEAFVLSAKLP